VLLLIPVVSIPEREMIVWRNPDLAAEIREGIAEAERGETVDLGSFAQYSDDEDED
jgi:predicted transcriptional regulator